MLTLKSSIEMYYIVLKRAKPKSTIQYKEKLLKDTHVIPNPFNVLLYVEHTR